MEILGLRVPLRFIVVLSLVVTIKVVAGVLLYSLIGFGGGGGYWASPSITIALPQNQALVDAGKGSGWPMVFLGWDSAWYLTIAKGGYGVVSESPSFYPLLSALTWAADLVTGAPAETLVVLSFVSGVACIPLFQLVCEKYMNRSTAMAATLIFALSPVALLFTTVAYAEGLFLALTLGSWALCLNRRYLPAGVLAGLATLARPPGYVFVIPLGAKVLMDSRESLIGRLASVTLPTAAAVLTWWTYLHYSVGDTFAYAHSTKWQGMYALPEYLTRVLPSGGATALSLPVPYLPVSLACAIMVWLTLIIAPLLAYRVIRVDAALGLYSLIYLFGSFGFGALVSVPRFLMSLFPLWISLAIALRGRWWLQVLLIGESVVFGFFLWQAFLSGSFVG